MEVILLGTPIAYVFIGLNNLMRATGYPRKAMVSALLSVGVNVIMAPIFIFVLDLGIRGAAMATVIGQSVACVWVLAHFISRRSFIHFNLRNRWFTPSIARRIYAIGMSPFLMSVCACIVVVFINKALLDYGGDAGDLSVGAYGILNRTTMFFVMIVFGVTQGMQPILGFNYGAGNWERVKRTLRIGIWLGMGITTVGWVITELVPVHHRPAANRHSRTRGEDLFPVLSGDRMPDSDTELLPVGGQTEDFDIPVAYAPASVSDPVPHNPPKTVRD